MIYQDPKSIVNKYLKKIYSAERVREENKEFLVHHVLKDSLKDKRKEDRICYEQIESDFIREFIKRKLKKDKTKKIKPTVNESISENSIKSLKTVEYKGKNSDIITNQSIQELEISKDSENYEISHSKQNKSTEILVFPRLKNSSKKEIVIPSPGQSRINSLSHIQKLEKNTQKKILTPSDDKLKSINGMISPINQICNRTNESLITEKTIEDHRQIPKVKNKAMKDYYKNKIKSKIIPSLSKNKKIESSLQLFKTKKLKNYKDFKLVKIFK